MQKCFKFLPISFSILILISLISVLLTFKFIQLRFFHQILLYVMVNFSINFFFQFFKIKKYLTND